MRTLALLCLVLIGGILVLLSIPNVKSHFDSDPNSLGKFLGTTLPSSSEIIRLAASESKGGDGAGLRLQAKVRISREDFIKMAGQLGLTQGGGEMVSGVNMFPREAPGDWWNPPQLDVQINLVDRYQKHELDPNHSLDMVMIFVDGTAYIYESKFDGPTGQK